jgi:hypothetical protein
MLRFFVIFKVYLTFKILILFYTDYLMGPRGAHCTASTSTAGRLRDGYCSQI